MTDVELILQYIDGRKWRLTVDAPYYTEKGMVVVPKGFVTDFASIPRAMWAILPPTGRYSRAAVIHDFLYTMGGMPIPLDMQTFTKPESDQLFRDYMEACGVGKVVRNIMYLAVKVFGGGNFERNKQSTAPKV